jgi:hypothetical protein
MIQLILEISFISAVLVLGMTISSEEGMIFYEARRRAEILYKRGGHVIMKPLILCVWCMASVYSIFGYVFAWIFGDLNCLDVKAICSYPIIVCLTSIISGGVWSVYELIETKKQLIIIKIENNETGKERVVGGGEDVEES